MNNEAIRRVYNTFEKKDMPFEEFAKELRRITDPKLLIRDAKALAETRGLIKK